MNSTRRKNILLLIPTFADEGGTQKMVYELGLLLSGKYTVFECSFDAFNESHIFKNGNTILSLECPTKKGVIGKLTGYFRKAKRLKALKEQYAIDVTISNLWAADLVNALSSVGDKKVAIGHVNIIGNFQNRLLLRLRYLASYIYNRFDKVVAVNPYLGKELKEVFRLRPGKATFINNFVALADHEPVIVPRPNTRRRLVNFGRLNAIKNQLPLLQAFASVRRKAANVQLVFMGAGPLYEELVSFAGKLGLTVSKQPQDDVDVVFTGFHPDPFSVLSSSDVFVFSSKSEGFGLVLVEAMHAGLPIVTSDCPTGGPHVIMEGKGDYKEGRTEVEETPYGFLLPVPGSSEKDLLLWEETILKLLSDQQMRETKGLRSKNRAHDFSRDKIKLEWFKLIENL